jgi:hypothetical protein
MSNSFLDAVHAEQAEDIRKLNGEPEETPQEKISRGLRQNIEAAASELADEVENLSKLAQKAKRFKDGDLGATSLEFGRGEKNRKTILELKAKYQPVRDALNEKYRLRLYGADGDAFWARVQGHLKKLDDIFDV